MKDSSFKDVVIHGKELPGALITALINVYIKDNASVDAISNHLRDICPLLYSSDDSVCSKVHSHTQMHTETFLVPVSFLGHIRCLIIASIFLLSH